MSLPSCRRDRVLVVRFSVWARRILFHPPNIGDDVPPFCRRDHVLVVRFSIWARRIPFHSPNIGDDVPPLFDLFFCSAKPKICSHEHFFSSESKEPLRPEPKPRNGSATDRFRYRLRISAETPLCQRVISPSSPRFMGKGDRLETWLLHDSPRPLAFLRLPRCFKSVLGSSMDSLLEADRESLSWAYR